MSDQLVSIEDFKERVARSTLFNNFNFGVSIYFNISFRGQVDFFDIKEFLTQANDDKLLFYILRFCDDFQDVATTYYSNEEYRSVQESFDTDDLFEERITKISELSSIIYTMIEAQSYIDEKYGDTLYCDSQIILEDFDNDNGFTELYSVETLIDALSGKIGAEVFA